MAGLGLTELGLGRTLGARVEADCGNDKPYPSITEPLLVTHLLGQCPPARSQRATKLSGSYPKDVQSLLKEPSFGPNPAQTRAAELGHCSANFGQHLTNFDQTSSILAICSPNLADNWTFVWPMLAKVWPMLVRITNNINSGRIWPQMLGARIGAGFGPLLGSRGKTWTTLGKLLNDLVARWNRYGPASRALLGTLGSGGRRKTAPKSNA